MPETQYPLMSYKRPGTNILSNLTISETGAMRLPFGPSGDRPPTGQPGMIRYNNDDHIVEFHNDVSWSPISLPTGGDAGAVLTSNGGTLPVSWNTPYYIRFFKGGDTNQAEGSFKVISSLTLDSSATSINASSDFSNDAWTPPAGIYLVNAQAAISRNGDEIFEVRFAIDKDGTGSTLRVVAHRVTESIADITYQALNISDIIVADGTDVFTLSTYINISGTGVNYTQRGDSIGTQTFFSAYKIA